jgi:hypothetical protein
MNEGAYMDCLGAVDTYDGLYDCNHAIMREYITTKIAEYSSPVTNDRVAVMDPDVLLTEDKLLDVPAKGRLGINARGVARALSGAADVISKEMGINLKDMDTIEEDMFVLSVVVADQMSKEDKERDTPFMSLVSDDGIVEEKEEDEMELFRRFGPCNPRAARMGEDSYESPIHCTKHGGCRMLTCWEYEEREDEEENDIEIEWFVKKCDMCSVSIKRKHEAVRMPIQGGGWIGCYCSWSHVKLSTGDAVVITMCDEFEKDYNEIGIYDRKASSVNTFIPMDEDKFNRIFASLRGIESTLSTDMYMGI